jgi:proteasome lid subunit RPN8/RPN11
VSLISSIIEGYNKEVIGVLFGDLFMQSKTGPKSMISHVIPLQIAKRKTSAVEANEEKMKHVVGVWDNITPYWELGDFHSHPNGDTNLSKTDKEGMEKDNISLVLSIRKATRSDKLDYVADDNKISGTLRGYFIKIAAWHFTGDEQAELAELWCPFIEVINDAFKIGTSSTRGSLFDDETYVGVTKGRQLSRYIDRYEQFVFKGLSFKGSSQYRVKIKDTLKKIQKQN